MGLFEKMLESWKEKKLDTLGELIIVDDQSPLDVKPLISKYTDHYIRTTGKPDTKNGLYHSLKASTAPALHCCEDIVFGKNVLEEIKNIQYPEDYGMVGLFACYEDNTRNHNKVGNLWEIKIDILYALLGHIFSPKLTSLMIEDWENVLSGKKEEPRKCDDLWVVDVCRENKIKCYNTMKDFVQHKGMNARSFGQDLAGNSDYYSKMFIGE